MTPLKWLCLCSVVKCYQTSVYRTHAQPEIIYHTEVIINLRVRVQPDIQTHLL